MVSAANMNLHVIFNGFLGYSSVHFTCSAAVKHCQPLMTDMLTSFYFYFLGSGRGSSSKASMLIYPRGIGGNDVFNSLDARKGRYIKTSGEILEERSKII